MCTEKYSTRGRVERQIQHEEKPSALCLSLRHPRVLYFFIHTSLGGAVHARDTFSVKELVLLNGLG